MNLGSRFSNKPSRLDLMEQAYAIVMDAVIDAMDQRKLFEETRLVSLIETSDSPFVMIEPEPLTILNAARQKCMMDFFLICKGEGNFAPATDNKSFWMWIGFVPEDAEHTQQVLEDFNQEYSRLADEIRNTINQR